MALDTGTERVTLELGRPLSLQAAQKVATGRARVDLSADVRARCARSQDQLARIISENRHVYGITTGFGPLANRLIDTGDGELLQQNLVHHLASGVGPVFDWATARAIVLARLSAIAQGTSGASDAVIDLLLTVLRSDLAPAIPSRGTVGASGDLTPLAHMVLCFQGRADFLTADGARVAPDAALDRLGVAPLSLSRRDGLALVNGTSAMTGIAIGNAAMADRLCQWALALSAGLAEVMRGRSEAWDARIAAVRPHPGQVRAVEILQRRISGSTRLTDAPIAARVLGDGEASGAEPIAQDAYTLRCVPQVMGGVLDSLDWHNRVVEIELSAVTDNPILADDPEAELPALHGGNFMGQHVGLVSDALNTAVTVMAGLAERQVARVTDERLNGGLPAFLHRGPSGLNSGLMGAQVTASALLAEMRSTGPASVHSISTNGANQDVVSMGTIAARHAREAILRGSEILAILALAVAQGVDICRLRGEDGFSDQACRLVDQIREISPRIDADRPLGPEIEALAERLRRSDPA